MTTLLCNAAAATSRPMTTFNAAATTTISLCNTSRMTNLTSLCAAATTTSPIATTIAITTVTTPPTCLSLLEVQFLAPFPELFPLVLQLVLVIDDLPDHVHDFFQKLLLFAEQFLCSIQWG